MPLVALGAIGAIGSVGSAAIASSGAGKAAQTQAEASVEAARIQAGSTREALGFEREKLAREEKIRQENLKMMAPWLTAGSGAISQLSQLVSPGGALTEQYGQFVAPTAADAQADPGYDFRLQEGRKALEASAAARGGLLTTGNLRQLERYGQDYASNEYDKVYGRRLGEHTLGYNQFQQGQSNTFNRLASLAGAGQTATGQAAALPTPGANSQIPNIILQGGQNQANAIQNAGAARASGYAAGGNIWGQAASDIGQMPFNLYLLSQLAGKGGGSFFYR